jgi:hypothetical protein
MLDLHSETQSLMNEIDSLPCDIELPDSWQGFFGEAGLLASVQDERRRFPRFRLRTTAAMRCVKNLPTPPRPHQWVKVFAKDVSRAGFSFVHSVQLFPGERLELVVDTSHHYRGEVRRCRKVGPNCYVVGAQFCKDAVSEDRPVRS